jgi:hypothetical protein
VSLTRLLSLVALLCTFQGCAYYYSNEPHKRYSTVRVTDIEGHPISQWIAEGFVARTERGYKFKAVERLSGPPFPQAIHYPMGRQIEIGGPNIVVSRCGKPLWLYRIEGP